MGRYDKMRVNSNGSLVQPYQIYARKSNNTWADLGTNTSYNTIPLYVYDAYNVKQRATLDREDYTYLTYDGEPYTSGTFQLLPTNAYSFSPSLGPDSNGNHYYSCDCWFKATMMKTEDVDQIVFHTRLGTTSYLKITWKSDGTLLFEMRNKNSSQRSFRTTNAVGKNNWVYFELYAPQALRADLIIHVNFNGVAMTTSTFASFLESNCTNTVGDTYIHFKDNMSVRMYNRPSKTPREVNFNINYSNGSATGDHTTFAINNLPVSHTGTRWV